MKTNKVTIKKFLMKYVVLFLILFSSFSTAAQNVTVNVTLIPPYSSNYNSYENLTNRAVITLVPVGFANAPTSIPIVLHGTLMRTDESFSVRTKDEYQGSSTNLQNNVPKTITNEVVAMQFLGRNNVEYLGPSPEQWADVLRTGQLPEGDYRFCVAAYLVTRDGQLVFQGEGCTNFAITNAQAPQITTPFDGQELNPQIPNTVFSWTPPIGNIAGANLVYDLYVVKVPEGQNPNDAINGAVNYKANNPIIKNNLTGTQYVTQPYDLKIDLGVMYAVQVIARDLNKRVGFKNNGRSEVVTFKRSAPAPAVQTSLFSFKVTNPTGDTLYIQEGGSFLIGWGWMINNQTFKVDTVPAFQQKNIKSYRMTLLPGKTKSGHKTDPAFNFQQNIPVNNLYSSNNFQKKSDTLSKIGMKNDFWYRVKVDALDANKNLVASTESQDFNLTLNSEKPEGKVVSLSGSLRYYFDGFEGINYPISHCQLKFFKKGDYQNGFYTKSEKDGSFTVYIPASAAGSVSSDFQMELISPYYRQIDTAVIQLSSQSFKGDTTKKALGLFATPVYNYSLTVNLKKKYSKVYEVDQDYMDLEQVTGGAYPTYKSVKKTKKVKVFADTAAVKEIPAGINVILYRKKKPSDLPQSEGDMLNVEGQNYIPVAKGKTAVKTGSGGEQVAYVNLKRLVCNFTGNNKDLYFIKAVNSVTGKDDPGNPYTEGSFESPEMEFTFSKPSGTDKTHFEVDTTYDIYSTVPPQSAISGQLLYLWPGDPQKTLRPLANRNFIIQSMYLLNGKPAPLSPWKKDPLVITNPKDKNDFNTYSAFPEICATGKTDANGNFSVSTLNLNAKGVVANATYDTTPGKPPPPPVEKIEIKTKDLLVSPAGQGLNLIPGEILQFDKAGQSFSPANQTQLLNGTMNQKGGFTPQQTQFFGWNYLQQSRNDIVQNHHGPNSDIFVLHPGETNPPQVVQRVFRIVLEDYQYFYFPEKDIIVQPLQNIDVGTLTVRVKEVKWKVKVQDKNSNVLSGIKAVVFREPETKTPNLPVTEGDGKYRMQKLINPKYSGADVTLPDNSYAKGQPQKPQEKQVVSAGGNQWQLNLEKSNVWVNAFASSEDIPENSYEWLADSETNSTGIVQFDRLLWGFPQYKLELASNPQGTANFFEVNIEPLDHSKSGLSYAKNVFPLYWDQVTEPVPVAEFTVKMKPLPSRVGGRVHDKASDNGMKDVFVLVNIRNKAVNFNRITACHTDSSGYFELLNVFEGVPENVSNLEVSLLAIQKGYKQEGGEIISNVSRTGSQVIKKVLMVPDAEISGRVIDENGKPVHSYIKRDDGLVLETGKELTSASGGLQKENVNIDLGSQGNGKFSMPAPADGKSTILYIIPVDVGYFQDTIKMTAKKGGNNLGDITVYRRKHRMRFFVKDAANSANVNEAKISLSSDLVSYTKKGTNMVPDRPAEFSFENVSVNNYTVTIEGPEGSGFIPTIINLKNEESKEFQNYVINLKKGGAVSGTVTLDGKPVAGAKVYLDYQQQVKISAVFMPIITSQNPPVQPPGQSPQPVKTLKGSGIPAIETTSDANGKYSLNGIPVNAGTANIIATLDTTFTVSGDKKLVSFIGGKTETNFALTSFKEMEIKNIYGFPLDIEKIETTGSKGKVIVTGKVDLSAGQSDFEFLEGTQKSIRISSISFVAKQENGKTIGVPANDEVELDATPSVKLNFYQYNVHVTQSNTGKNELLKIRRENQSGLLSGYVHIVDNSFNYPSSYLSFGNKDGFYLASKSGNNFSNLLGVIRSVKTGQSKKTIYNLSDETGKSIKFKFIGFDAMADVSGSYIDQSGKIHLKTDLSCHIPHATPEKFSVHIPDIVLDNGKVYPASSDQALSLQLEKWSLQIKNWKIDPVNGGIYSTNGLVKTGKMDVPFKKFNLRADMFVMDEFEVNKVSLGGGVKLIEDIAKGNASLLYDTKTGSDMKGHWKFAISGTGSGAAGVIKNLSVNGIGKTFLSQDISLQYVELLSNGEDILTIQQSLKQAIINNNALARFSPQMIYSGTDYFTITGGLDIPAPRLVPVQASLQFTGKPQSMTMQLLPVQMSFEAKGYVNFFSDQKFKPEITANRIKIDGYVLEKDGINPITSTFYAENNSVSGYFHVDLLKDYVLNLSDKITPDQRGKTGTYNLIISSGKMEVPSGASDWDVLSFTGNLFSNDKTVENTTDKSQSKLTFTINGEVAVEGEKLKVSQINTPFGAMSLSYDYANNRLAGTLEVKDQKIGPIGATGIVQILLDPAGWYLLGACSVDLPLPIPLNNWNMGFLVGNRNFGGSGPSWENEVVPTATQFSHDKTKVCWIKNNSGIHGFFITAGKDLINIDIDYGIPDIASIYLKARAGIEASIFASFNPWLLQVSAGVSGEVTAGADAVGVSASGSAIVYGSLTGEISLGNINVSAEIGAELKGHIKVVSVFDGGFSVSTKVNASVSTSKGIDASFHLGKAEEGCQ